MDRKQKCKGVESEVKEGAMSKMTDLGKKEGDPKGDLILAGLSPKH